MVWVGAAHMLAMAGTGILRLVRTCLYAQPGHPTRRCVGWRSVLQAVLEQRAEFGKRVVRKVPVEWIGVASEVKVMGDFDDWTRGHELSAEDVATDSVYSR